MRQQQTLHVHYRTYGDVVLLQRLLDAVDAGRPAAATVHPKPRRSPLTTHHLRLSRGGLRCDWAEAGGSVQATLLQSRRLPPEICYHATKTWRPFPIRKDEAVHASLADRRFATHKLLGETECLDLVLDLGQLGAATLSIESATDKRLSPAGLAAWWRTVLPFQSRSVDGLGLAARVAVVLPDGTMAVRIEIEGLEERASHPSDFERPAGYRPAGGGRQSLRKAEGGGVARPSLAEVRSSLHPDAEAPARAARRLFALMPNEDVKVLFSDTLITRAFEAANRVSSYLGEFSGERFIFETHRWAHQVDQNAPLPPDGQSPSVLPASLIRAGLVQMAIEIGQLDLGAFNGDFDLAVDALADPAQKSRWQQFLARVDQRLLRPALAAYAARDIAHCGQGAANDAQLILAILVCADPLLQDYRPQAGELASDLGRLKEIGRIWLGNLLPQIDVAPDLPSSRTRQGAQVFYSDGRRTITVDSLLDLVNIDIGGWTHRLDFGRQPLLAPLQFLDAGFDAALRPLFPAFAEWDKVRVGVFSGLRLRALDIECEVDIEPTFSAATFFLGLFCPPCLFALFHSGTASVEAADIELPLFLYAHQDALAVDAPALRMLIGEPHLGSSDVSLLLFDDWFAALLSLGLSYVIDTAGALLAAILGDDVLQGVLNELSGVVSEAIDRVLAPLPPLNPGEIVKIDSIAYRQVYPQQQAVPPVQNIAYRGLRAGPHFHFETTASLGGPARNFGPMVFPPGGGALDTDLAVVMSNAYVSATMWPLRSRSSAGPLLTQKPGGAISEVDWWLEAPDQTGMPPRPATSLQGPPPGLILQPGVQASYWGYSCLIWVNFGDARLRDLNDARPDAAVAEMDVRVRIRADATRFVTISYEVCDDVTRFAAKMLDPRDGRVPQRGPRPGPSPDPRFAGTLIEGRFKREAGPVSGGASGARVPGSLDDARFGYLFDAPEGTPWPDDPGPAPVPGVMLCKTVTTWDVAERETWLDCETQLTVTVHLGILETLDFLKAFAGGVTFLPLMDYRIDASSLAPDALPLTIHANGPLATLQLPANQAWIRTLMLEQALRLLTRGGLADRAPLRSDYGLASFVTLEPGAFQPSLFVRLDSFTTFQTSVQGRNLAIRLSVPENILNRL